MLPTKKNKIESEGKPEDEFNRIDIDYENQYYVVQN
jgi:hypothetical protein